MKRPVRSSLAVSRVTRARAIASEIEREILESPLEPGVRLGTKSELQRRFSVAPATVGEALRILESGHFITTRPGPGGGVFVGTPPLRVRLRDAFLDFEPGDAPFADCLIVRNALEPLICRDAARHCTPDDASALHSIVAEMSLQREDAKQLLLLGWRLHRRIAEMSQNGPLRSIYLTLLDFIEDGLHDARAAATRDPEDDFAIHRDLAEAIIGGDPETLEAAILRHTPVVDVASSPKATGTSPSFVEVGSAAEPYVEPASRP